MPPDKKIDALDSRLEHFKQQDRIRQDELNTLLAEYRQLLGDYKALKRAHEDKITSSIAKPVVVAASNVAAPTRPRDSYVLVLVDGNDYIFNDELISDREEGGMRAARKLNDAIEKYLDHNTPKALSRRVIVRIYANITNLSKQLGKLKLTGFEKRSIADFTAGFTRAMSLFDFIDTLDEEGTKFKIREQFKIASEDAACGHILFAACNDPAYLSQLMSYKGARDKITLVQGSKWHPEFHQFSFEVTQFPTVFSWWGISSAPSAEKPAASVTSKQKSPVQQPVLKPASLALSKHSWRRNDSASVAESAPGRMSPTLTAGLPPSHQDSWRRDGPVNTTDSAFGDSSPVEADDFVEQEPERARWDSPPPRDQAPPSAPKGPSNNASLCRFFQKGYCRYESKCKYSHGPQILDDLQSLDGHGSDSQVSRPLLSPTLPSVSGSSSAQALVEPPQRPQAAIKDRGDIKSCLPQESVPGFVPINKFMQRLDPYMPEPTTRDWQMYNMRFQQSKPCNAHHLTGNCTVYDCQFDHSALDPQIMRVLEYVVKRIPCSRKGACRIASCVNGHLCQKAHCTWLKGYGAKRCRFSAEMHYTADECEVGSLVPAYDGEEHTETAMQNEDSGLTVDDLVAMEEVDLLW